MLLLVLVLVMVVQAMKMIATAVLWYVTMTIGWGAILLPCVIVVCYLIF